MSIQMIELVTYILTELFFSKDRWLPFLKISIYNIIQCFNEIQQWTLDKFEMLYLKTIFRSQIFFLAFLLLVQNFKLQLFFWSQIKKQKTPKNPKPNQNPLHFQKKIYHSLWDHKIIKALNRTGRLTLQVTYRLFLLWTEVTLLTKLHDWKVNCNKIMFCM